MPPHHTQTKPSVKTSQEASPCATVTPPSPGPEQYEPSLLSTDGAAMCKKDASVMDALTITEVVNDGLAIAALCDSRENLGTCDLASPQSEEWEEAAQAASVARVKAEPAASRILICFNSKCMWCNQTHQNLRDLCPPSLSRIGKGWYPLYSTPMRQGELCPIEPVL